MQKKIFFLLIVVTSFNCKTNSRHDSIIDFFPSKKDDLYEYGFKKNSDERGSVYLQKMVGDTILRFFYPYEGYYVKDILFRLSKFDSIQLYSSFFRLDKNFSPTSNLTIVDPRGGRRTYDCGFVTFAGGTKAFILTYIFGKRRENSPGAEPVTDSAVNR